MKNNTARKSEFGKGEKQIDKEQFLKKFTQLMNDAERKYDAEVTVLLKVVDEAEKAGNAENLELSKKASDAWIEYFEALDELVKKTALKDDPTAKSSKEFVEDQIKFFTILSREIERKIKTLKLTKIRKVLEN